MYRDKKRYGQDPNMVVRSKTTFDAPLDWNDPKMIFTCSWSDWLIEEADPWRDEAYDVIRRTPWHTYQILTKRIERAEGRVPDPPLDNIWWGISCENQQYADERIRVLLRTPASCRFVSAEPLLGPIDFIDRPVVGCDHSRRNFLTGEFSNVPFMGNRGEWMRISIEAEPKIDWVIVGGESGPDARPMHPDWVRSIRDQCVEFGVPFFFKQWGAWRDRRFDGGDPKGPCVRLTWKGRSGTDLENVEDGGDTWMEKFPKSKAGRLLDGRTWDEMPFAP